MFAKDWVHANINPEILFAFSPEANSEGLGWSQRLSIIAEWSVLFPKILKKKRGKKDKKGRKRGKKEKNWQNCNLFPIFWEFFLTQMK